MAPLLVQLLFGFFGDGPPPPPPPALAGVGPPGVATGGDPVTWTFAGRDLLGADEILVDPPGGLWFGLIRPAADGSTLAVAVRADPDAAPGVRMVRVGGPSGTSNPLLVRVDPLPQVAEADRDDEAPPPVVAAGTAVAGTLRALGVDRYRVEGPPGRRVVLDWEARRLGVAIDPVLTATGPEGDALGTARADPTIAGDARLVFTVPAAGWFAVDLRDNTYRGSNRAHYRLRIVLDPPADPPAIPDDPRLNCAEVIPVEPGGTDLRGTLAVPGEVDRHRVVARAGERLRIACRPAPAGSPLDPVVTLRDANGRVVAEADDVTPPLAGLPPSTPDGSPALDARLDFIPASDGPLTVEVADRSQGGGPSFGYALAVGPPRDDFALLLLPSGAGDPHAGGAWDLRAGEATDIPLVIVPEGHPGTIEVRVEGLPPGLEAEPITVRTAPARRAGTRAAATAPWDAPPLADALRLRATRGAAPVRGSFRVVARRLAPGDSPTPDRVGTLAVPLDAGTGAPRPTWHGIASFPARILGDSRP